MSSSTASTSAESPSAGGPALRGVTRRRLGLYEATLAAAGAFTLALDLLNALVWHDEGYIVTYRGMALVALALGVGAMVGSAVLARLDPLPTWRVRRGSWRNVVLHGRSRVHHGIRSG
ncbi:hypothetical protein [Agilicoccus flavus]|uniref:hypothetical protein n=1 Tax=Agilicoccus flavus TaxID=2775968 RepID=UPI001CF713A6|nr:hypothetical protein [Agilicoccus flavus]